jgi:hypothetical protein
MMQQYHTDNAVSLKREWRDSLAQVAVALDAADNDGPPCRSRMIAAMKADISDEKALSRIFNAIAKDGRV